MEEQKCLQQQQQEQNQQYTIMHWNVNGIQHIINNGHMQNSIQINNPDIICINEMKMSKKKYLIAQNFFTQNNYNYQSYNLSDTQYHGVAVFSKVSFIEQYKPKDSRIIVCEFDKFSLLVCYAPYTGQKCQNLQYKLDFFNNDFINAIKNCQQKNIIIAGDLNVVNRDQDIHNPQVKKPVRPGFHEEERKLFKQILKEQNLIDIFVCMKKKQQFTYWNAMRKTNRQQNKGWRIDYFLTQNIEMVKDIQIKDEQYGSDHCPVLLNIIL